MYECFDSLHVHMFVFCYKHFYNNGVAVLLFRVLKKRKIKAHRYAGIRVPEYQNNGMQCCYTLKPSQAFTKYNYFYSYVTIIPTLIYYKISSFVQF